MVAMLREDLLTLEYLSAKQKSSLGVFVRLRSLVETLKFENSRFIRSVKRRHLSFASPVDLLKSRRYFFLFLLTISHVDERKKSLFLCALLSCKTSRRRKKSSALKAERKRTEGEKRTIEFCAMQRDGRR